MYMTASSAPHRSILVSEYLSFFENATVKVFVDGTLGAGGHAEAMLEAHPEIELLLGIDQDPLAREIAGARLAKYGSKFRSVAGNFADLPRILKEQKLTNIDGLFLDIGVSSMQLDRAEKGFSFSKEGPLDMRMDPAASLTAEEIINTWTEQELAIVFRDYGEMDHWRNIARYLVDIRKSGRITTTTALVAALQPVLRPRTKKSIHPATLLFQALRIAVNDELEVLRQVIPAAIDLLRVGGRMGIITFHSLEDRIVKHAFRHAASDKWDTVGHFGMFAEKTPTVQVLTKKPVEASDEEVEANPRSRSAKMRFVEKVYTPLS